jgi:hypothetical protein
MEGGIEQREKSQFPLILAVGALVVLLLAGGVVMLSRWSKPTGRAAQQALPFGAEEQAYAVHIHFLNPEMSRSANYLNQEFTYVSGEISNDGARTIRALDVTLEFHDPFHQVVLRETERLIPPKGAPLLGGQGRSFQLTFEHIPVEWDQRFPSIRVTGLVVE